MKLFDEVSNKAVLALEKIRLHLQFIREKRISLKSLGAIKLSNDNLPSTKKELTKKIELQDVVKQNTELKLFPILSSEENKKDIKEIQDIENKRKSDLASGMDIEEVAKSLEKRARRNILLIDDVMLNIEVLSKELRGKCPNFNITIINDPIEAFELIKSKEEEGKQFDLILTDIEMPNLGGIELTFKIRNEIGLSKYDLPILAYSSREKRSIIDKALESGINHYYTKPKDLRFIARNISKWVLDNYIPSKNIYHQDIIVNDSTLAGKYVILADDQIVNLMILSKQFKDRGANIVKCKSGKEIIDLVEKDPVKYHLIVTDINMKEVGGVDAAKEVIKIQTQYNKKNNTEYKTPIIAFSGDNDKLFVMNILNSGIDDYLTKGCSGRDMVRLSKFWIDYYHQDQGATIANYDQKSYISSSGKVDENTILRSDFDKLFSSKEETNELINIFEHESNNIMSEIEYGKYEIEPLRKAIHKLKGLSGSIGANKLLLYTSHINSILQQDLMPNDKNFDAKIRELLDETIKEMKNISQ